MQKQIEICASLSTSLRIITVASLIWIPLAMGASAQEPSQESDRQVAAPVVPQQVRYAGKLAVRAGQTVQAEFRIYAAAEGGEPLWSETQQFPVAADGAYSVLLGSASQAGLPQSVFAGGAARWLGVSIERAPEQERVLLSSVPYAMKSADAESLSGHAASDFVTQEQLAALAAIPAQPAQPISPVGEQTFTSGPISGSGTSGNLAVFTGANTIGNSDVTQVGNNIGINVASPAALLDVGGTADVRGTLDLPSTSTATTAAGFNSQSLELTSSAWSTTSAGPVAQNFFFENIATGNNTATPAAKLDLLFAAGAGSPAATGLSFGSNGLINFAAGQTFPGASTITTITTASPLTGGGSSGPLTLSLSLPTLEASLDTVYPQLATGNTFHANQSITGSLTTTGAVNTASLAATTASIQGLTTAIGGINVGNNVQMHQINLATSSTPYNSPFFQFIGSAWNSSTSAAVNQNFSWQTVVTGNNTASPSGYLQLLSGSGSTQAATGLSIAKNGNITFAPGQTFPITGTGGGTITGITTTSPLAGSGTSGSVALSLNTAALETTLNTVYPRLATGNIFSSYLEAYQTAGPGNAALLGWGSSGSVGAFGDSDTGYGVQGESTSGYGVYAQVTTPAAGSSGVLGFTGSTFSATYTGEAGIANAGVWADNSKAGTGIPLGLFATGDDAYGAAIINNGPDYPALFVDNNGGTASQFEASTGYGVAASTNSGTAVYGGTSGGGNGVDGFNSATASQDAGVLGTANIASATYNSYNIYSGVWGDTGTSSTAVAPAWAIGVLGTADDSHAGVFLNDSTSWSTMYISNASTGGTGLAAGGIFKTFMASSPDGTCGIGSGGSLSCTGQIKSLVSAGGGARTVETYAVQSPENWMEDFGSGEMHNGVATVTIDPAFAETVTGDASYHVFITPNGDSKSLYVISKTPNTFEVRESGGGTSSLSFDYRIVAKRRGYEAQRLVDVTERFNAEQRSASLMRSSGIKHKPAPLARSPLIAGLNAHPRQLVPGRIPTPHKPLVQSPQSATPRK